MLQTAVVKWMNPSHSEVKKRMGYFILPDGQEIFAHWDCRRGFSSMSDEPVFSHNSYPTRHPSAGDKVMVQIGPGRRGTGPRVELWGYEEDYNKALKEIEERKERTAKIRLDLHLHAHRERMRCNPVFRYLEQTHQNGKPVGDPRVIFEGTRSQLIARITPPSFITTPLLLTQSGKVGGDGRQYVRWPERATAEGWVKCEDPLKIDLPDLQPLTFEQACVILTDAICEKSKQPYGPIAHSYSWRAQGKNVASGHDSMHGPRVTLNATDWHAETSFTDDEARYLQTLGVLLAEPVQRRYSWSW